MGGTFAVSALIPVRRAEDEINPNPIETWEAGETEPAVGAGLASHQVALMSAVIFKLAGSKTASSGRPRPVNAMEFN